MKDVFKQIAILLGLKKNYKIQSFTFFVPSPPPRSTGYREKQFDKVFYEFINRGYRILNFSTQLSSGEKQSGMWIVAVVQALNEDADQLNLEESFADAFQNTAGVNGPIEGLYYIDDEVPKND